MKTIQTKDYLLLIDEEAKIKYNNYYYHSLQPNSIFKAEMDKPFKGASKSTINQCSKIIAYYPLTKEAKELDLPLLPLVGLETEEGKILKDDGIFVYLQNGKKYKKSELELWVENT